MLELGSLFAGRYRVMYVADERPGCILYQATEQPAEADTLARTVLIAECPQHTVLALEDTETLARATAELTGPGMLPLLAHFAEGQIYYMIVASEGSQDIGRASHIGQALGTDDDLLTYIDGLLQALERLHTATEPLLVGELQSTDTWVLPDGALVLAPFALIRPLSTSETPYRAPELEDLDTLPSQVSDIYALGAVCYHMLTGWAPPVTARRLAGTPLPPPHTLRADVAPLLEQVVLRMLAMYPGDRYQSVAEVRRLLQIARALGGAVPATTAAASPFATVALPPSGEPAAPATTEVAAVDAPTRYPLCNCGADQCLRQQCRYGRHAACRRYPACPHRYDLPGLVHRLSADALAGHLRVGAVSLCRAGAVAAGQRAANTIPRRTGRGRHRCTANAGTNGDPGTLAHPHRKTNPRRTRSGSARSGQQCHRARKR
ncbi:MAG: hypothetical protein HC893_15170 [Chloroflexaceae bacterium]|nr:hypothetical protein [Chloroflexaceae bacterium]